VSQAVHPAQFDSGDQDWVRARAKEAAPAAGCSCLASM
jgi:hypothetical protein